MRGFFWVVVGGAGGGGRGAGWVGLGGCGGLGMSGCWGCVCGLTLEEGGVVRVGMGWDIVVKDLGMYGGVYFLVVL